MSGMPARHRKSYRRMDRSFSSSVYFLGSCARRIRDKGDHRCSCVSSRYCTGHTVLQQRPDKLLAEVEFRNYIMYCSLAL